MSTPWLWMLRTTSRTMALTRTGDRGLAAVTGLRIWPIQLISEPASGVTDGAGTPDTVGSHSIFYLGV